MGRIVNVAVVGYGGMGGWHTRLLQQIPEVHLAGVYDILPERNKAAEEVGIKAYESYEALLADPAVDVVTVAIPNDAHKDVCIQAMEAGAKGRFIPASLNKDGSLGRYSSALSQQELHTVLEYSKLLIAAMGRELLEGRVEPEPALTGRDSCRYCPYSPVCGRELGGQNVKQDKTTPQEALAQMEEALQKGGKAHG